MLDNNVSYMSITSQSKPDQKKKFMLNNKIPYAFLKLKTKF